MEEKPEVRKAGGVYYTPSYIVDYIVQNTLGVLLEPVAAITGRRSSDPSAETAATDDRRYISLTDAAKLKVVDPACGSGSFLIVAYQYLLDWHRDRYAENPEKWSKGKNATLYQAKGDEWRLTTAEKKRILLNNIHGVDIDAAAVEVTKLSLLLKVLEGETGEIAQRDFLKERERILPDLSCNIKCGNSLIGPDFYDQPEMDLLDDEARFRVNVFDWKTAFPEVFKQGGFDAVIGNPPYVILSKEFLTVQEMDYLNKYEAAQYKTDLFHLFIQQGVTLMRKGGKLGFIVPSPWLTTQFTSKLRKFLLMGTQLDELILFNHLVFAEANVFTMLLIVTNDIPNKELMTSVRLAQNVHSASGIAETSSASLPQHTWLHSENQVIEVRQHQPNGRLASKIISAFPPLTELAIASLGCQAYNSSKHSKDQIKNRVFHSMEKQSEEYLPELAGSDVDRYQFERKRGQWIKYGSWLHDYRPMELLTGPRVLIREIPGKPPRAILGCYVEETYCHYKTILNVNPKKGVVISMKFMTGLLNSSLLSFVFPYCSNKIVAQAFPRLSVGDLKRLPIRPIDYTNPTDVEKHDRMVSLVDRMLDLVPKRRAEANPQAAAQLDAQIAATDRQIDRLVYDLYGLTDDEIALVEGA
ncbi:MAG: N-6 DNA methylase [Verrucomicrobia bacterium]|nr:N-6 DNA methylase [Verrucomicrobiota bacterium]